MADDSTPRFLARGMERSVVAGAPLWETGAEAPVVCYVLDGEVDYMLEDGNGTCLTTTVCGTGSVVGIVDTYAPGNWRVFRATARRPTVVYCWTREQFDIALGMYQELAREVIQTLSMRLRVVNGLVRSGGVGSG